MRKNGQGGVDWDNPGTVGPEGPLPLIVFSKTDEHVGLLVGVYSGIRCSQDFDAMYGRLDQFRAIKWQSKTPVSVRGRRRSLQLNCSRAFCSSSH